MHGSRLAQLAKTHNTTQSFAPDVESHRQLSSSDSDVDRVMDVADKPNPVPKDTSVSVCVSDKSAIFDRLEMRAGREGSLFSELLDCSWQFKW